MVYLKLRKEVGKVSYQTKEVGTVGGTVSIKYRFIISITTPTPATDYEVIQVADLGELGKLFVEYKLIIV